MPVSSYQQGKLGTLRPAREAVRAFVRRAIYIVSYAYYFDSGDSNSVRETGLFCAEIPSKV